MGWLGDFFDDVKDFVDDAIDAVVDFGKSVVDIVISPFGAGFDAPDVNASVTQQNIQGPLLNKDSGVGPIPVVYGTRRVGGHRVFVSTNGTDNKFLYVALVMSEGQINALQKLFIDDTEVTLNSYAHGVQATPTSGAYSGRLVCQFFDGRDDQTVSTLLDNAPGWGSNHRLRGLAYLALRFEWKKIESQEDADNNPYGGGIPNINALIQGKKIFDITNGYTPAATAVLSNISFPNGGFPANNDLFKLETQGLFLNDSVASFGGGNTNLAEDAVKIVVNEETNLYINMNMAVSPSGPAYTGSTNYLGINITQRVYEGTITQTGITRDNIIKENTRNLAVGNATGKHTITITDTVRLTPGTYYLDQQFSSFNAGTVDYYDRELDLSITWDPPTSTDNTTAYGDETETFSNNPVSVVLDYMRNPRYGKGLANTAFHWSSWREAAIQCDQTVPYDNDTPTTGVFFATDAVLETSQSLLSNIKQLLQNFRGIMPYQQGQYHLKVDHSGDDSNVDRALVTPPVALTITEDDIIGGINIQGDSKERKINQARVTFTDPDADYRPNDVVWPPEDSAVYGTYKTEDGGIELHKAVTLPFCTNRERALNYAETMVKVTRARKTIDFGATLAAANVSVGDIIRLINTNLNFDGFFRVLQVQLGLDATIKIGAAEHVPTAYVLDGHAAPASRPVINLPDPLQVSAPTNLAVTQSTTLSGSGYTASEQLDITWTASTDPFTTEYIVQVKPASDSTFYTVGLTNDTEFFWGPVATGDQWDVRVAARNELDRRSDYATVATYTVT